MSQEVEAEVFRVRLASTAIGSGFKAVMSTKHIWESMLGLLDDNCTLGGL
jgi:hypothetical protein